VADNENDEVPKGLVWVGLDGRLQIEGEREGEGCRVESPVEG
jgi:hypothetical protein